MFCHRYCYLLVLEPIFMKRLLAINYGDRRSNLLLFSSAPRYLGLVFDLLSFSPKLIVYFFYIYFRTFSHTGFISANDFLAFLALA